MIKERKAICMISTLMCILLLSPKLVAAMTMNMNSTMIIDVQTTTSSETIRVLDEEITAVQHVRVETFGNGMKNITISLNFSKDHADVCITMNTMTSMASMTTKSERSVQKPNYAVQTSMVYPWKDLWDGLVFVKQGNNGTHIVCHDHDDNLDTYYPDQPYAEYTLAGLAKDHGHLPTQLMAGWLSGAISRDNVIFYILAGAGGSLAVLGGLLAFFVNPLAGLFTITAGISAIIGALLHLLGWSSEADWIQDRVIETQWGDAWTWIWGGKILDAGAFIVHPPILYPMTYNDWYMIFRHHRIQLFEWQTVEFLQSWGGDRDSPQTYRIDVSGTEWVNPGIFGSSADDFRYS